MSTKCTFWHLMKDLNSLYWLYYREMCIEITGEHASFRVDDGSNICLWNICTFTSEYLYQTAWHISTHVRVYDTSLPLHWSEWHICQCVSDCMTSKNTAVFIVTVMEVSNLTKVHSGKTVQSGVCVCVCIEMMEPKT